MSLSLADSSYLNAISQWIDNHLWVGSGQQQSILVVEVDDTTQQYQVQSGFGDFQIGASYTPGVDQLDNLIVSLDVPSFGLVLLAQQSNAYPLSANPGQDLAVSVADGSITGSVSFKYVGDGDNMEVYSDYTLNTPYSGTIQDSTSIFPVDFQRVQTIDSSQSSDLKRSEGKVLALRHLETRYISDSDLEQQKLLLNFLQDFSVDGNRLLLQTWGSAGTSDTGTSKKDVVTSDPVAVDVSFLGVFNLVGSIEPGSLAISASLYVRIPYIGRILVVSLSGDLGGAGVTATIDAIIAAGTATLTAEQNSSGTHDLYINANVNIKMIGNVNTDEFLLLTMPF